MASGLSLPAYRQRVEVRVTVVRIYTLGALETVDDDVGQRCGEGFVGGFDKPLGNDSGDHGSEGNSSNEGQEDEDERIETLSYEGRADRAAP